jgi:hypothetical protein
VLLTCGEHVADQCIFLIFTTTVCVEYCAVWPRPQLEEEYYDGTADAKCHSSTDNRAGNTPTPLTA